MKKGDFLKLSAIIAERTSFRSLPEHFSSIIVYARSVQWEDNTSRPTQSLKRFFQVAAINMCASHTHRRFRIAADSIFSAIIAVPLFADVQ